MESILRKDGFEWRLRRYRKGGTASDGARVLTLSGDVSQWRDSNCAIPGPPRKEVAFPTCNEMWERGAETHKDLDRATRWCMLSHKLSESSSDDSPYS